MLLKWIKRHPRIIFSNGKTFDRDFYSKFRFTFSLSIFLHCFKIPRTKSLFSLFEFLSIKISPSHSSSICPAFNFVFISLSVNRTAFEQGVQREQKRAFTVVPLMRSPDADCLRWQANFFDYSRCIGFSRRIHDLIARMQGMVA